MNHGCIYICFEIATRQNTLHPFFLVDGGLILAIASKKDSLLFWTGCKCNNYVEL